MCKLVKLWLPVLLVLLAPPSVTLGAEPVTPMHLVGHEDIALLDRVQDLIDDWDPRKLVNPIFETVDVRLSDGTIQTRKVLKRADLGEFIADVEAAEVLGKAFFWDMQAGSDFRRLDDGKTYVGSACASCHYRNGADARSRHTMRIPYIAWDKYKLDPAHPLEFGESQLPYNVKASAVYEAVFPKPPQPDSPFGNLSLTVGSAGVEPRIYAGNAAPPLPGPGVPWESEKSKRRTVEDYQAYSAGYRPQWSMFIDGQNDPGQRFRQITPRNSPSVINSGFADRLFHDGRAESTFNGFSIFGDRDQRPVLFRGVPRRDAKGEIVVDKNGVALYGMPVQVHVAITKAALASQAVGPIVSDVEMSYTGRTFPNVACKLLDAKVLPHQEIDDTDSVLGKWKKQGLIGNGNNALTYRQLIQRAFRREWWDAGQNLAGKSYEVPLVLLIENESTSQLKPADVPNGEMMAANFPLYWGLAIMFYESSLVSNQSPFDGMMRGNSTLVEERWQQVKADLGTIRLDRAMVNNAPAPEHKTGSAVFQHGFRVFMNRGCIECHGGPLFSEVYDRLPEAEDFPIHERLETALLPNSRSDAIALERTKFHNQTLDKIAQLLAAAPVSLPMPQARRLAASLDSLRELARGNLETLTPMVKARLQSMGGSSVGAPIAQLLLEFEKDAPKKFGNRTFFTEDERVAMAEQIAEPVFVESMPIPPRQVPQRPRLPIQGPLSTEDYAFYDLGFYAIGNSPPRYDAGVGEWEAPVQMDAVLAEVERSLLAEPAETKARLLQELTKLRSEKAAGAKDGYQVSENLKTRLKAASDNLMAQRPNPGTPGSSNRFRSAPGLQGKKLEASQQRLGRQCHEGPTGDPDAADKSLPLPADWTWDRNHLPENRRRSDLVFHSHARTLVSDENPWGFRKPFLHDNELAFWGAFKTPSLRNVEITAPYMHNGRFDSLAAVIDFYDRGGDLDPDLKNYPDKHPEIVELDMTEYDKKALRFFLICLTDEHVRREQAPFDHPALELVHGYDEHFKERVFKVSAIGAQGWTNPTKIPAPFPHRQ